MLGGRGTGGRDGLQYGKKQSPPSAYGNCQHHSVTLSIELFSNLYTFNIAEMLQRTQKNFSFFAASVRAHLYTGQNGK